MRWWDWVLLPFAMWAVRDAVEWFFDRLFGSDGDV